MLRITAIAILMLASAGPASANTWAEGLFDETFRDFGTVPAGPMLVHPFRVVNNSKVPVQIGGVRVSCGLCTSARVLQSDLAPGQETVVLVHLNTRQFLGKKDVTVYVTFTQPKYEEVRLQIRAVSTHEISFAPESLTFGKVKQGATPVAIMTVTFLNSPQTQITECKSESNYIQPKVQEIRRELGEVTYQVTANLRPDIPEGKWFTDVWLTTNNVGMPKLRVPLTVDVEAPAKEPKEKEKDKPAPSGSPTGMGSGSASVVLGQVKANVDSDRKVILRGAAPFRITSIHGADKEMTIRPASNDSKSVHVLTVTIHPTQVGTFTRTIRVQTDLQTTKDIEFNAQAEVVP